MAISLLPFSDEQRRVLVNLQLHYEAWLEAERAQAALPYGLQWKTVSGRDYLYQMRDRAGNGTSRGPRSPATEAQFAAYTTAKAAAQQRARSVGATLAETASLYRALRRPMLPSPAAPILREADRRGLLGSHLLVIGTNAMLAYALAAGGRIADVPDETQDFDLAWSATEPPTDPNPVWAMLKAVDATFTVNSERPFLARNAAAYEVELLAAPSRLATMARRDQPRPTGLPEQEWLLLGTRISEVLVARDGSPARLVVPDPRWFALHKLWLAAQDKRDPRKRPKDARQGSALLDIVWQHMPRFPLDDAFRAALPVALQPHFAAWQAGRPARNESWRRW